VQFAGDVELAGAGAEYVRVACYGRRRGSLLYTDFHAVILIKRDVEQRCRRAAKKFIANRRPADV